MSIVYMFICERSALIGFKGINTFWPVIVQRILDNQEGATVQKAET